VLEVIAARAKKYGIARAGPGGAYLVNGRSDPAACWRSIKRVTTIDFFSDIGV